MLFYRIGKGENDVCNPHNRSVLKKTFISYMCANEFSVFRKSVFTSFRVQWKAIDDYDWAEYQYMTMT